jgi:hypothetical protein
VGGGLPEAGGGALDRLSSAALVRERCGRILERGLEAGLEHFALRMERLPEAARRVAASTRRRYPSLEVPLHSRWRHFEAVKEGGRGRLLEEALARLDSAERARARIDLTVASVLLDAGAGERWRYTGRDGSVHRRSEGLAAASLDLFLAGGFSSDASRPLAVDAAGLEALDGAKLGRAFQASAENPLVGLAGRAALLARLASAMRALPAVFGPIARPRLGSLLDHLRGRAAGGEIPAEEVLRTLLDALAPVWQRDPGGAPSAAPGSAPSAQASAPPAAGLGDVWPHPAAGGSGADRGLVPLHKLPQWLAYSLVEPLEGAGLRVTEIDGLTGLAEYRNGGLFIDTGVLVPKREDALRTSHAVGSGLVVEWRALTVALLDRLVPLVRGALGLDSASLPLARMLEGGTWIAGRELARELRPGGGPPIRVEGDGTVF